MVEKVESWLIYSFILFVVLSRSQGLEKVSNYKEHTNTQQSQQTRGKSILFRNS